MFLLSPLQQSVFFSGFSPKLFILLSVTEVYTWYWTCIENNDGPLSDLVWYFTHILYYIYYIYTDTSVYTLSCCLASRYPFICCHMKHYVFFHLAHHAQHVSQGRISPWSDVGDRRSRSSLGLCPVKVDMNVCWSTRHLVITTWDLSETFHTC